MKKITQKQLIDYCNNAPWGHCSICPYDSKECKIYCIKYGTTPAGEHYYNPERYTDEDILIIENQKEETINKNTVENCCKNCEYSGNYDGWNEFICKYYNGMIRGEQYDCEGFKPEGEN